MKNYFTIKHFMNVACGFERENKHCTDTLIKYLLYVILLTNKSNTSSKYK